jgi:hypothetical protein
MSLASDRNATSPGSQPPYIAAQARRKSCVARGRPSAASQPPALTSRSSNDASGSPGLSRRVAVPSSYSARSNPRPSASGTGAPSRSLPAVNQRWSVAG